MKNLVVILLVLVIAVLGILFVHSRTNHAQANVPPPVKGTPVSFTDSNGNEFTVYVGGATVNGTNINGSNFTFKIGPAAGGNAFHLQTNAVSK